MGTFTTRFLITVKVFSKFYFILEAVIHSREIVLNVYTISIHSHDEPWMVLDDRFLIFFIPDSLAFRANIF